MIGNERLGPNARKSAVVPTKSIPTAANVSIIGGHHVLALQSSPEGRQATPLLERRREPRVAGGRVVQRHVLYLGEINDTQELAWRSRSRSWRTGRRNRARCRCFRRTAAKGCCRTPRSSGVKLSELRLCRPRQWGACWLALSCGASLQLDRFWAEAARPEPQGDAVGPGAVACWRPTGCWRRAANGACIANGFERSAMADLLGEDVGLAEIHKLYRCHDRLLEHKQALVRSSGRALARPVQHQLRRAALCALSPSQALSTGSPQFVHITCCCESGELDFLGREWTRLCFAWLRAACAACSRRRSMACSMIERS